MAESKLTEPALCDLRPNSHTVTSPTTARAARLEYHRSARAEHAIWSHSPEAVRQRRHRAECVAVGTSSLLVDWLETHPAVWAGWPTWCPTDHREWTGRLARLRARGAPCVDVTAVHQAVATARSRHRVGYRRRVAAGAW